MRNSGTATMSIDPKDIFYIIAIFVLGLLELRSKDRTSDADMVRATSEALKPLRDELTQVRGELKQTQTDQRASVQRIDQLEKGNAQLRQDNDQLRHDNDQLRDEIKLFKDYSAALCVQVMDEFHGVPVPFEDVKKKYPALKQIESCLEISDSDKGRKAA